MFITTSTALMLLVHVGRGQDYLDYQEYPIVNEINATHILHQYPGHNVTFINATIDESDYYVDDPLHLPLEEPIARPSWIIQDQDLLRPGSLMEILWGVARDPNGAKEMPDRERVATCITTACVIDLDNQLKGGNWYGEDELKVLRDGTVLTIGTTTTIVPSTKRVDEYLLEAERLETDDTAGDTAAWWRTALNVSSADYNDTYSDDDSDFGEYPDELFDDGRHTYDGYEDDDADGFFNPHGLPDDYTYESFADDILDDVTPPPVLNTTMLIDSDLGETGVLDILGVNNTQTNSSKPDDVVVAWISANSSVLQNDAVAQISTYNNTSGETEVHNSSIENFTKANQPYFSIANKEIFWLLVAILLFVSVPSIYIFLIALIQHIRILLRCVTRWC